MHAAALLASVLVVFAAAPETSALPTMASHSRRSRLSANVARKQQAADIDPAFLAERHSGSFSSFLRTLRRAKADPLEQAALASFSIDVPEPARFAKRDIAAPVKNLKKRQVIGTTETRLRPDEVVYDEGAIPSREVARRLYLAQHQNERRQYGADYPASVTVTLVPTTVVDDDGVRAPTATPSAHVAYVAAQPVVAGSHTLSGNFVPVTLAPGSPASGAPVQQPAAVAPAQAQASASGEPNPVHGVIVKSPEEVAATAATQVVQSVAPAHFANDGPSAMFTSTYVAPTASNPNAPAATITITVADDTPATTVTVTAGAAVPTAPAYMLKRDEDATLEQGEGTEWQWEDCILGVDEGCEPIPEGEDAPVPTSTTDAIEPVETEATIFEETNADA